MMEPSSSDDSGAVVGRAEDVAWFDTMPGERMALRVNSVDVGGAFTIVEADVPAFTGPPLHYHEEREEIFEVLDGRFRFLCAGDEFEPGRDGTRGTAQSIHRRAHGRCGRRFSRGGMAHGPDSGGIGQGRRSARHEPLGWRRVQEGQGRLGRRHPGRAGLIRIGRLNLHSERH
jgi:hypothetical protein